jgi:6-pyruvoyltetrahydropterin/6-carboxytetrahydropterin synthase
VTAEIEAALTRHGLVLDFKMAKPVVREMCDELDEHFLLPAEHPVLQHGLREDGVMEVRYLDRYYALPAEDVVVLPINNSSSENLATWFGRELMRRLRLRFEDVDFRALRVSVEETRGQRGVYHYSAGEGA